MLRLLILFSFRPVPTTQLMNQSQRQLEERDVKLEAPMQNPVEFMRRYLASNFPQTAAMPSADQKATPSSHDVSR